MRVDLITEAEKTNHSKNHTHIFQMPQALAHAVLSAISSKPHSNSVS